MEAFITYVGAVGMRGLSREKGDSPFGFADEGKEGAVR